MDAIKGETGGAALRSAGQRRYVAVLFCDLSGSTALAAGLDADVYAEIIEAVRIVATPIIEAHGGIVAQVYGDGMLSIFAGGDGAAQAVDAALALHSAVARLAPAGVAPHSLRLHSGVHAGLVVLRQGDSVRGSVEAVGRTTSVAARLSAAAAPGEVLVSAESLGPDRSGIAVGAVCHVDIGDGQPPIAAVPVARAHDKGFPVDAPARLAFVGRTQPLAALATAAAGLARGAGFRIAVSAPPGQGKSWLAHAFAERLAADGITILRGLCSAESAVGPLRPFRQIAAALASEAVAPDANSVAATLPGDIAARLAVEPLVLILDDWQWADVASVTLLSRLCALDGPLGLLVLSRAEERSALALEGFEPLSLQPMTAAETAALVRSRRPQLDPIDAMRIHGRSGGNPLYADELCQLDPRQARSVLSGSHAPVASGWLAALVGARVEQLPGTARRVLETAAVIGQAPPQWLLEAMVGAEGAAAALPALVAADFLAPGDAEGALQFKHGITHEIIYSMIPLADRNRLHAAIASALEARGSAPGIDLEEALAWHFRASQQPGRSWPYAERAGDRAAGLGSLDRARLHYRHAIETIDRLPGDLADERRYQALVGKYGYVCIFDADASQLPIFTAAIARARVRGDSIAEAEAEFWLGYVAHGGGFNRLAIDHCQRALALLAATPQSRLAVQVRATLGQALAVATDYGRALPLLDEAIATKRANRSGAKASTGMAYSLAQRAAVLGDMGDFAAARAMLAEAFAMLHGESPPVEASIMGWVSAIAAWQGDWPGLLAAATRGCDVAQRIEAVYIHAISRAFAAFAEWQMGGGDSAADALAAAIDCMVDRGKFLSLSIAYGFQAEVEVHRGNAEVARRAVAGAFARGRAGDPMGVAWAARAWGSHLATTAPDRARVYLARARTNAARRQSRPEQARCDLVEARLGLDGPETAAMLARRARLAFDTMGMPAMAAQARAIEAMARG